MASSDASPSERPFRIEVTIAAPADVVWHALRDPSEIRRWHGWEDPSLEAEIELIYGTGAHESADRRTLTTAGGDTFALEAIDDHETRLTVTRGPRDPTSDWDAWYEEINEGWTTFAHQLRLALERHRGAERRTLYFSGRATSPGSPQGRLGLDDLADRPIGGRYELTLVGEPVQGEVWYRSQRQVGLTVDGWGDGLVVVGEHPHTEGNADGGDMVVITTYGLPEPTIHDLKLRWDTWWQADHVAADPEPPLDQSTGSAAE